MSSDSYKFFYLVLLFSTLLSCVASEKCSKVASELAGKGMMGGWSNGDVNSLKADLTSLLDNALANSNSKENVKVLKDDEGHMKLLSVYTQVVNGINYCVTFLAENDNCKANDVSCQKTCDAKIWQQGFILQGAPIAELLEMEC